MTKSKEIALLAIRLRLGFATADQQREISKRLSLLSHLVAIDEKTIDAIVEMARDDFEAKCLPNDQQQVKQEALS